MIALTPVLRGVQNFWDAVVDVWTTGVFGASVGAFALALCAVAAGFLFRGYAISALLKLLDGLARRTAIPFDDALVAALGPPLRLVPVLVGFYVALSVLGLPDDVGVVASRILDSALTAAVFWTLARLIEPLFSSSGRLRTALTPTVLDWTKNALKALVAFVGVAAVLEKWGIQVGPILAGLGIFGAAVALGAQDLFKNLLGGLAILLERRFGSGDWILVDGVVEGTVEKIGFRSTHVRRFDKSPVYVPNAQLADNAVTNFSRMTHRRIKWVIGVGFGTTVPQLKRIRDEIHAYIEGNANYAQSDEVTWFIRVDAFNDSSIDFLLYCFTKTTDFARWMDVKEALAIKVKEAVEGAGASFALPARTIHLAGQNDPAELFIPPPDREKKAMGGS